MELCKEELITDAYSTEEEQECESAEDPRDIAFWVSMQLMLKQPSLEDTSRVQETRGWEQNEPSAEHYAVGFEAAVQVSFRNASERVWGFHL
jgi:hypothetical protein